MGVVEDDMVMWNNEGRDGLNLALNESEVLGLRMHPAAAWCDLLVHVLALPARGPLDPDARRILRLVSPRQVKVVLRTDPTGTSDYGPAISLASIGAVEDFFESLDWSGSMYGWKFFDDPALTKGWPDQTSLNIDCGRDLASHSIYWFNECGADGTPYCLEGTVTFDELQIFRADHTSMSMTDFISDGRRHWQALQERDERLSVEAQKLAMNGTPSWRPNRRQARP